MLVRQQKNGQFSDVTVDCAGTVGGWQPLDSNGEFQYTRLDLVTGNFASVGGCNNGLHVASSQQPFGLVVWGWGSAASVGFTRVPSGGSVVLVLMMIQPAPEVLFGRRYPCSLSGA